MNPPKKKWRVQTHLDFIRKSRVIVFVIITNNGPCVIENCALIPLTF